MGKNIPGRDFSRAHALGKGCASYPQRPGKDCVWRTIESCRKRRLSVLALYVDIDDPGPAERTEESRANETLLNVIREIVTGRAPEMFPGMKVLSVEQLRRHSFVALLSSDREPGEHLLQDMAVASRIGIRESLKREMLELTGTPPDVHVGCAVLDPARGTPDRCLHQAVSEAEGMLRQSMDLRAARLMSEFRELLATRRLDVVYQPIASLRSGNIIGWEALTRGPKASRFGTPDILFSFAEEAGLLFPLEKTCRSMAVDRLGGLGPDERLFLNIHPRTVADPQFARGETLKLIREVGISPRNVVFEITERHWIRDYAGFNKTLQHYRSQGFLVAVDDAGSGFSCLQSIAEIRPDFIKMDMTLVRNIHTKPVNRALIETFVTFADKIGMTIIAEGIETEEELRILAKMGVHYGQGYFLARPAYPKPPLNDKVALKILNLATTGPAGWKITFPVADIVERAVTVARNTSVRTVKRILDENDPLSSVVVVDNGAPAGLVMRNHLYRHLGMQYGVPLYYDRPVETIMDRFPLLVDEDTPIETVSQLAMEREKAKLYDSVVVVKNRIFRGLVSVQSLLDAMTRIRLEMARGANPLTGLPGNNAIEQEFFRRSAAGVPFCLIYLDLDNFKAYNDRFGFENGDRVLLFTARLLLKVVQKYGDEKDFLGHVGGDDFVLITAPPGADEICRRTVRYFDRLIPSFYPPEDRKNGRIPGIGRDGRKQWFPFVSASMALLDCGAGGTTRIGTVSEKAGQLKRFAKSIPGSVYVRDRREL